MQDAGYAEAFRARTAAMNRILEANESRVVNDCEEYMVIPVAVHYQEMEPDFGIDCAIAKAEDQIQILNDSFSGATTELSDWASIQPGTFPSIQSGESCIRFCLATLNHPTGFGLIEGEPAVTIDQTSGDNTAEFAGYFNIYVRDIGFGILGYSPLGGSFNGDGVVMHVSAFSSISCDDVFVSSYYGLGRYNLHEAGHYLNLIHPWGSGTDGCSSTDLVDDTPITSGASFGCPSLDTVSCVDPILTMNFMEYTYDSCMYMFTEGQVARMEAHYIANLQIAQNQASTICQLENNRIQFIHNSPDPSLDTIDVYLNDNLFIDNLPFSSASSFLPIFEVASSLLSIAPSNSSSILDTVIGFSFVSQENQAIIMVLDGVLDPSGFNPAPALSLEIYEGARLIANELENTDIIVHHGSMDSPDLDLTESGAVANFLAEGISYTGFQGYSEWITDDYELELFLDDGITSLGTFEASLSSESLEGLSITLLIAGFQEPSDNNNGEALNILMARASGGPMTELPLVTSLSEPSSQPSFSIYPIPASDLIELRPILDGYVTVQVMDLQGRILIETTGTQLSYISVSELKPGSYVIRLQHNGNIAAQRIVIQRH